MAWHFDETSGHYVTLGDNAALTLPDGDWTIGGWIKLDDNLGSFYQYFLSWGRLNVSPSCNWFFNEALAPSNGNKLSVAVVDGGGDAFFFTSSGTPGTNTAWQHLALARASGVLTQYINGAADGSESDALVDAIDVGDSLYLGMRSDGSISRRLGGSMAEWAKWNRALSAGELLGLAAGWTPDSFPTPAWHVPMFGGQYIEKRVPLTVTNNNSTAADHPGGLIYPPPSLILPLGVATKERYFDGSENANWAENLNWAASAAGTPPASAPVAENNATFGAGGDGNVCTLEVSPSIADLTFLVGYTSKFDMGVQDLTCSGDMTFDGGGEFDCGMGTTITCGGNFDNKDQATWTKGTSTLVMDGASKTITSKASNPLHHVTIDGTISIVAGVGEYVHIFGTLLVNASKTLTIADNIKQRGGTTVNGTLTWDQAKLTADWVTEVTVGASGIVNGSGVMRVSGNLDNSAGGTWSVDTWVSTRSDAVVTISADTYGGDWELSVSSSNSPTLRPAAGTTTFTGSFLIDNPNGGSAETATMDLATNNASLILQGDWTLQESTADKVVWSKAATGTVTISGVNQRFSDTINTPQDVGKIVITNSGTYTLDSTKTCTDLTGTSGGMDVNGEDIDASVDVMFASGFDLADLTGSTIGCEEFSGNGQTGFNAVGEWFLQASDGADIVNATITNCNAGGFAEVDATVNCEDGGGNTNVDFGTVIPLFMHHYKQLMGVN